MSQDRIKCGWQGYGFGAAYQDAACCDGQIGDLDDCDEPGGAIGLRDETCPQCGGHGSIKVGDPLLGPMALLRQRGFEESTELAQEIQDEELRGSLLRILAAWHTLVNKLESVGTAAAEGVTP